MDIIETIMYGCIGGLAVVLPYVIYTQVKARKRYKTNMLINRNLRFSNIKTHKY